MGLSSLNDLPPIEMFLPPVEAARELVRDMSLSSSLNEDA
jgi:hypothetical protein